MHRRPSLLLTLTALFCLWPCPLSVSAQSMSADAPYPPGEKLTYTVSFSTFAPAAHVELFVAGRGLYFDREGVELRAHVETVETVRAALFAINNDYTAYINPQTGLPFRTRLVKHVAAAPPSVAANNTDLEALTNAGVATEDVAPTTYDLLAALYHLRTLALAPGAVYPFTAQRGSTEYRTELRVTGGQTIKTPAGSFNTIATQVRVANNAQANNYHVRIYFTNDARHVPVLITLQHRAGEIRAELASIEIVDPTPAGSAPALNLAQPQPTPTPARVPAIAAGGGNPDGPPAGATDTAANSDLPFKVGEQLNFSFYLGAAVQPVGVGRFQVRSRARYFNREAYQLVATLFTTEVGTRLFPVSDALTSYVDAATLLPFRTELRVQEGKHRVQGLVSMDQERGLAVAADGQNIEVPVGTYDWLSVLYALRSFDLTPPKRNAVSLLLNKHPRTLFITALRREVIELGGQRIPAIQLSFTTDEAQGDRLNLRLWVSADRRRLPLRVTAVTPIGPVRADLTIIPLDTQ